MTIHFSDNSNTLMYHDSVHKSATGFLPAVQSQEDYRQHLKSIVVPKLRIKILELR